MRYTVGDKEVTDILRPTDENGPLRVMQETEFFDMLTYDRPGTSTWKPVVYLQTVVKSKLGMGQIFEFEYTSEIESGIEEIQAIIDSIAHLDALAEAKMSREAPLDF